MNTAHAMWYLTRGTGVVALVLVTASVLIGIAASLRAGGIRMPRFVVAGLHRNVSLLTVAFIVVHVVTTVLDAYAPITFLDAVVPFASPYRPVWLGLGAVAFDLILALVITSLVRVRIGLKTWRGIHWFAYACFPIAAVHALGTGTDASQRWMLGITIACTALVVGASLTRLWQLAPGGRPQAPRLRRDPAPAGRYAMRAAASVAVLAVPLIGVLWALAGPLAPKWAQRAGTPPAKSTSNPLAELAARQAKLDRVRQAQIQAESDRVRHQLAEVKATLAAVKAASQPVSAASGYASGSSGGGYSGSSGGYSGSSASSGGGSSASSGGGAAVSAPAPVAAVPAAPVAATGGS